MLIVEINAFAFCQRPGFSAAIGTSIGIVVRRVAQSSRKVPFRGLNGYVDVRLACVVLMICELFIIYPPGVMSTPAILMEVCVL